MDVTAKHLISKSLKNARLWHNSKASQKPPFSRQKLNSFRIIRFMKRFFLAITCSILVLYIHQPNNAQTRKIIKRVGSINIGWNYKPNSVKSLTELPTEIAEKVKKHLIERIGEEFYNKLQFSYGLVVDYNELCRLDGCQQEWKVLSYKLEYAFSLPEIGIKRYETEIWLDEKGDAIKEIDLPAIKQNPEKARLISVTEAINIGKRNKFRTSRVELGYREADDSIVWKLIKNPNENDDATREMHISAHDGKILFTVGYKGIE
jgi:hypothetical protein